MDAFAAKRRRIWGVLVVTMGSVANFVGCQPAQVPDRPTVSLRLSGTPSDATVVIDDETLGTLDFVGAHGVALPPGVHHVSVTAAGYLPWDKEVQAELGGPAIRLAVSLARIPD